MNSETTHSTSRQRMVFKLTFIIWFVYSVVQLTLLYLGGFDFNTSLHDALITASMLALACIIISNALNYYLPSQNKYIYIVIWTLVLAAMVVFSSQYIINLLLDDIAHAAMLKVTTSIRYIVIVLLIGWVATLNILYNIQIDIQETEERKRDAERLAKEAELFSLRQQLQPHFLFNSLNSIIALIGKKPDEAKNMTFQLSNFLRGTVRKDDNKMIPLKEELDHVLLYLDIEKVRFGHRLKIDFQHDLDLSEFVLPPMILQPIIENAIKFGLFDTKNEVFIKISIIHQQDLLIISISNPYSPDRKPMSSGTGFGIRGIQRRLFLLFGRTDLCEIKGENKIFTTTLKIPQI